MIPKSVLLAPGAASPGAGDPTDPEAIVRVLFEKSPLLIYISDLEFKIVLFNRALRDATGYDTSDCRNVPQLLERFYPDEQYRQLVHGIHEGWVRNEHIRGTELVATVKDGGQRTISWSTSRLRIGRGPTVGYIAIGVDVTTRRNLQQWVGLLQRSLQHLEEGVILTDPGGSVLAWSAGAERYLGYTDQQMQGRPLKELYLRSERELIARTVDRQVASEGRYVGEVELEHVDGGSRILLFNQVRLEGESGALARLTLLSAPSANDDLAERLAEATATLRELDGRTETLRTQVAERDRLIAEASARQADSAAELSEAHTRLTELTSMLGAVETSATEAQANAERDAADRVRRIGELERALEAAQAETAAASERTSNTAAMELAIAQGEAADAADALAAALQERDLLQSQLASAAAVNHADRQDQAASLDALRDRLAQSERTVAQQEAELAATRQEAEGVARVVARAEQRAAQLEADIEALRAEHEAALTDTEQAGADRIEELEKAVASSRDLADQANERAEAAEAAAARIPELEAALAASVASQAAASEAADQLAAVEAEHQRAQQRVEELEADKRQSEERLADLEAREASATAELAELTTRSAEAAAQLAELEAAHAEITAREADAQARHAAEIADLEQARDQLQAQIGQNQLAAATELELATVRATELEDASSRLASLEAEAARAQELEAEAASAQARVAELEGLLAAAEAAATSPDPGAETQAALVAREAELRAEADARLAEVEARSEARETDLLAELQAAATRADELSAKLEDAGSSAEAGDKGAQQVEASAELGAAREQVAALRARVAELESAPPAGTPGGDVSADLRAAEGQITQLRAAVAAAKSEAAVQLVQALQRASKAERKLRSLDGATAEADASMDELTTSLEAAERQAAAKDELIAASEANRLAAEQRRETLQREKAELEGALGRLASQLDEARARLATVEGSAAPAADDGDQAAELKRQLEALREQAEQDAGEASERWVQERASLEEAHRAAMADAQSKAAAERRALEEQLSLDILAAEERAEEERIRVLQRHEKERREWEDAGAIARAEADSRLRHEVQQLQVRLQGAGNLQPHLVPLESVALVAADTEGRVVGWSGGASLLDNRDDLDAVGAFIHKDVCRLDGVNWKTVFGKVVVEGAIERDAVLVARGGERKDVILKARLVKNAQGAPIGVTEVLAVPGPSASLEVHAQAAVARMAFPLHRALEARAIAGLKTHQGAAAAVRDLLTLGRSVEDGEDWSDIEGVARRVDLGELLVVTDDLVTRAEDTWRELRATARDLQWLEAAIGQGSEERHRWNELVTRCLHAVQDGLADPPKIQRRMGNHAFIQGRGDFLIPLLMSVFSGIEAGASVELATAIADGEASLVLSGASVSTEALALSRALAASAGGRISLSEDRGTITIAIPLAIPTPGTTEAGPASPLPEARGRTVDVQLGRTSAETTVPTPGISEVSAIVDLPGLEDEDEELDSDMLVEQPEDEEIEVAGLPDDDPILTNPGGPPPEPPPRRGMVQFLEEQDDGGLVLMAGEDSVIAHVDDFMLRDDEVSAGLPDIDELEQLFDAAVGVSASVLATADDMDAYSPSDRLGDPEDSVLRVQNPTTASLDVRTDAGSPPPEAPSPEVQAEMAATGGADGKPSTGKQKAGKKRKAPKSRRRKR